MYRTVAPCLTECGGSARDAELPLRLARIVRREFPEPGCRVQDPDVIGFLNDATARRGTVAKADSVVGTTFAAMARDMVSLLRTAGELDEPFDLVVVAHATPDLHPWVSPATYLNHALPGDPLTFSVSDQGLSAAYTALRIIADYSRRHSYRRALLLLADQSTASCDGGTAPEPGGDVAVALVLDASSGSALSVEQFRGIGPSDVDGLLAARVAGLGSPEVVAGPGILGDEPKAGGRPCGGIWRAVTGPTVFADYDAGRGELSLCLAS
ncbi:hypothetical protein [Amycolatopsis sp. CA-230715]|uniref:hypothetical protein n=1 Tax=Amycolatopsis sp. CA-230715 TaxID=2745196 RepID=UPI001C036702|nr:hypothetical protein [Amycolatopsis sp. CA-230715]QWF78780.1 hypothetical protein HUW46_02178 [Amycolatopsis sp. CA-230715]